MLKGLGVRVKRYRKWLGNEWPGVKDEGSGGE